MIKTLTNIMRQDKEKFKIPKSVQQTVPIKAAFEDGLFLVGAGKYSKTYRFTDINYQVASREDKESMFLDYSELLNSFDSGATTKLTIINRKLNESDFENKILIPMKDDGLDRYRNEYNHMIEGKLTAAESMIRELYLTVSVCKKTDEEAKAYFRRIGADITAHLARLGSKCTELDAEARLKILHDFYHRVA